MVWEAIGSLASGIFSRNSAVASAAQQYQYNLQLQKQNQEWQEYMSNTSLQRGMADAREAGINPLWVVTGGHGASTPSGGTNSVSADNRQQAIQQAITTAQQIKQISNETKQVNAQVKNLDAMTETEQTKQKVNMYEAQNKMLDAMIKDKQMPYVVKEIASRIKLNNAMAFNQSVAGQELPKQTEINQTNAETNRINAENNMWKSILGGIVGTGIGIAGLGKAKAITKLLKTPEVIKLVPKLIKY